MLEMDIQSHPPSPLKNDDTYSILTIPYYHRTLNIIPQVVGNSQSIMPKFYFERLKNPKETNDIILNSRGGKMF